MARKRRMRRKYLGRLYEKRFLARTIRGGNRFKYKLNKNILSGVYYFKRTLTVTNELTANQLSFGNPTNGASMTGHNGIMDFQIATGSAPGTQSSISFAYVFQLTSLPNLTEFTGLFDAYKIKKVVTKLMAFANVSQSDSNVTGGTDIWPGVSPMVHFVIDHDSALLPAAGETGLNDLKQYASYKVRRLAQNKPVVIVVKPHVQISTLVDGATVTNLDMRNKWLDLSSPTVLHFGLRGQLECFCTASATVHFPIRWETTYYLTMKGVR